jgi:hypothetical protein
VVDWEGYADGQGIYRACLKHGKEEARCDDFMHSLIEAFVGAVRGERDEPIVPGEIGLMNLEHQIDLMRLAKQS